MLLFCFRSRMLDSAAYKYITIKVFMINMIKYVYNKIDHKIKIISLLYTQPTAHERDPIGVQEIIQFVSTSIHDYPASIIAPFEILLDEEINDDFFRDAI